jgi:hypothetical protein
MLVFKVSYLEKSSVCWNEAATSADWLLLHLPLLLSLHIFSSLFPEYPQDTTYEPDIPEYASALTRREEMSS